MLPVDVTDTCSLCIGGKDLVVCNDLVDDDCSSTKKKKKIEIYF